MGSVEGTRVRQCTHINTQRAHLEVVYSGVIRQKWQNIFNLQQTKFLRELHGPTIKVYMHTLHFHYTRHINTLTGLCPFASQ